MINIAYIANPNSIHDCKWINIFSQKYNIIVLCSNYDENSSLLNKNIEVYKVLPLTFPIKEFNQRRKIVIMLKSLIRSKSIDIIHSMYAFPNAFWPELLNFNNHIITTRGSDILIDYKNLHRTNTIKNSIINNYLLRLYNKCLISSKIITSTSSFQQVTLENIIHSNKKLRLIRTGIDIGFYEEESLKCQKISSNNFTIFSPRSMKPIYNIDVIIDAFHILYKSMNNTKLILIDDFPDSDYSKSVRDKIRVNGLQEKSILLPRLSQSEMIKQYNQANLIISIPYSDGTPNTVLEAMVLKKPVILGNANYDKDLFSGHFKIKKNDKRVLAKKILEIIQMDKKKLIEINNNNHTLVTEFANLTKSILKIDSIYNKLYETKQ